MSVSMDTNNKTSEQIVAMYDKLRDDETALRESIRHFLSRHLMDTSEEKPMRTRMAPAPANTVSKGSFDLGF